MVDRGHLSPMCGHDGAYPYRGEALSVDPERHGTRVEDRLPEDLPLSTP